MFVKYLVFIPWCFHWKDKEIIRQQIVQWTPKQLNETILDLVELELQVKKIMKMQYLLPQIL